MVDGLVLNAFCRGEPTWMADEFFNTRPSLRNYIGQRTRRSLRNRELNFVNIRRGPAIRGATCNLQVRRNVHGNSRRVVRFRVSIERASPLSNSGVRPK